MKLLENQNAILSKISELLKIFENGCKTSQKLGVEYEKLPINNKFLAPEFFFNNGILDFLTNYKEENNLIPYFEDDFLLGLFSNGGAITLEPGCQVEYSLKPEKNISEIEKSLKEYNELTYKTAQNLGINFLSLGIQPISTYENIKVIPKKRYSFMTKYLIDKAELPFVMMRETAGIQVSIDYLSEEDAIKKLSCAIKLSPFLSAFFSNSPIRNGKLSGYKSFRAYSWLNTDEKRCGLISKKLFENNTDFSFSDYVDILFDVPMIFNKSEYVGDKTFREIFENNNATLLDWQTHISLFFTDVRLKNYIEIRNHDCQKLEYALAIPALYKGILYSNDGIEKIKELLKDFTYYDYEFVRHNAPRFGIDFEVNNIKVSDIVKNIFQIAYENLKNNNDNEEKYLEPAMNILFDNMTPADIIIKNFEGSWNKNIEKLIEYSTIK